ncbi:hypothetical protein ACFPRL_32740 [Pseudoclavibacter helvolus]
MTSPRPASSSRTSTRRRSSSSPVPPWSQGPPGASSPLHRQSRSGGYRRRPRTRAPAIATLRCRGQSAGARLPRTSTGPS